MLPAGFSILGFVIFFLLTFALIFLILVLVYVFMSTIFERLRRRKLTDEVTEVHEDAYEDALKILDAARVKSVKLFGDSQLRAQKILGEAGSLSEASREDLVKKLEDLYSVQEETFKQLSAGFVKSYKEALEKEKTENIRTLAETTEMIKDEVLSDIDEFKDTIRKSTIVSQQQVEEKLTASYQEVEKEIQRYKEEKIAALNSKIFHILADLSEKVIGSSIDLVEHEKFILDTLKDEVRKLSLKNDPQNKD
jgi:ABC-type multidrug transport system fused ATPase/permease subunit